MGERNIPSDEYKRLEGISDEDEIARKRGLLSDAVDEFKNREAKLDPEEVLPRMEELLKEIKRRREESLGRISTFLDERGTEDQKKEFLDMLENFVKKDEQLVAKKQDIGEEEFRRRFMLSFQLLLEDLSRFIAEHIGKE